MGLSLSKYLYPMGLKDNLAVYLIPFIMTNKNVTSDETAFTDGEFDGIYPEGIQRNFWHTCRNRFILEGLSPKLTYMDVGSGRGVVTDYLYKHGITIEGAELGESKPMPNNTVLIHYKTDATELPINKRLQIQVLTFFDVIEHIEQPVPFLESMLAAYPNVTELVFTVPARQEIWTNFDAFNRHFMRYSLADMQQVVKSLGFQVVTNRYFFQSLYWLLFAKTRFSRANRDEQQRPPKGMMAVIHGIIGNLMFWESKLLPKHWYGSSVFCVCRR
jgi:Methyltransferase domain